VFAQPFQAAHARHARQHQVHQCQVGCTVLGQPLQGLLAAARFHDLRAAVGMLQQQGQAFAEQRVVVDEQDAQGAAQGNRRVAAREPAGRQRQVRCARQQRVGMHDSRFLVATEQASRRPGGRP
jgi:hypothetical protein